MNGDEHESADPEVAVLRRRVEQLGAALDALRAELEAHRASLRRGVVTERVTVVSADGFERIVLSADERHGSVAVRGRSALDGSIVELFANDVDGRAHVGLALSEGGDVVSVFEHLEDDGTRFWSTRDVGRDDP